jgi:hypothetical protein
MLELNAGEIGPGEWGVAERVTSRGPSAARRFNNLTPLSRSCRDEAPTGGTRLGRRHLTGTMHVRWNG